MSILGNRIKDERERLNLTREDFAKKIGVSYSAIAMYERGEREPNNELTVKMSEIFGCSVDYLIGKSNIRTLDEELKSFLKENIKEELISKLKSLELDESELEKAITAFIENYMIIADNPSVDIYNMEDSLIYYAYELITKYYFRLVDKELSILTNNSELLIDKQAYFDKAEESAWKEMQKILQDIDTNDIVSNLTSEQKVEKLLGKLENKSNFECIPIVGKIAAGKPILAQENIEGTLPIDLSIYGLTTAEDLFYLLVSGQSMNMKVKNGDYALIHKQDYAEDGDIVVAIVNGDDEATLKRYKKLNDQFILLEPMSTDPSIEAITVDLKNTNFKIIGKAIGQFGKF